MIIQSHLGDLRFTKRGNRSDYLIMYQSGLSELQRKKIKNNEI